MGKLIVTIGVGDPQGQQLQDIEVIVSPGSTLHSLAQNTAPDSGSTSDTLSPVPAGRRQHRPDGHGLDNDQARGQDLPDISSIRRGEPAQRAGYGHLGRSPIGSRSTGTTAGVDRPDAHLAKDIATTAPTELLTPRLTHRSAPRRSSPNTDQDHHTCTRSPFPSMACPSARSSSASGPTAFP